MQFQINNITYQIEKEDINPIFELKLFFYHTRSQTIKKKTLNINTIFNKIRL